MSYARLHGTRLDRLDTARGDHLDVAGEFDLLLAGHRRRARARPDAAGLPGGRAVLRADRADLPRGRHAASRASRFDRLRALRVQRARQLHRRRRGAARLRDPDRDLRADRCRLPGDLRARLRPRRAACRAGARHRRLRRRHQRAGFSPLRHVRRVLAGVALRCGHPAARDRDRFGPVLPPADDHRPHPPRQRAELDRRHLCPDDHDRRLYEPRVGVGAVRGAGGRADRRAADHLGREPDDPRGLRRHRRGRRDRRTDRERPLGARDQPSRRSRDRDRRALPPARAGRHAQVHRRRRRDR